MIKLYFLVFILTKVFSMAHHVFGCT